MQFHIPKEYIDNGLVTEKEHPTEPYLIYNYTPATQFSRAWDDITMQCRGLIVHRDTREVIARPFSKFFNYEEHITQHQVPNETPNVYEKRDGSLGILYWGQDNTPYIATRGSFTSDQAIWATAWFREHGNSVASWDKNLTYLFEIIYPENRIVVDYGEYKGLDLLAIIDTKTGTDVAFLPINTPLGNPVRKMPYTSYEELKARNEKNREGFILHYPIAGLRLKIKFEDYVRLHKVMTGLSEKGIWEMLRDGKDIIQIISEMPDEMHEWAKSVALPLLEQYVHIETMADRIVMQVENLPSRKEQAIEIMKNRELAPIVFPILDKKDYSQIIWKMLRPVGSKTFRVDIDR